MVNIALHGVLVATVMPRSGVVVWWCVGRPDKHCSTAWEGGSCSNPLAHSNALSNNITTFAANYEQDITATLLITLK
ncbi:hypothetical protein E2C01_021806 [Portunus trituberculatus]|uniref:Secreted protein n=1 Tax=Portunus trituberculatus TaxID=210409 RepID=A0A5B7E4E0_PORTR|nr:hypothetical protein [Portunus trituberculatus]